MIKKIEKIKDFGVFEDYEWGDDLEKFKHYNFIYGANYSGKTTFSRIFRSFEEDKLHPDFEEGEFLVRIGNNQKISQNDLDDINNVRVFNTGFIESNIGWYGAKEGIDPILVLGKEDKALKQELEDKSTELEGRKKDLENKRNSIEQKQSSINSDLSEAARIIKRAYSITSYDRTKFKPYVERLEEEDPEDFILSEENLVEKEDVFRREEKDRKKKIEKLEAMNFSLKKFYQKAKELIGKKITKGVIQKLRKNPEINKWVKEGLKYHEDSDKCHFCGQRLPSPRIDNLEEHFSEEYNELERRVTKLKEEISKEKKLLSGFEENLPHRSRFYDEFAKQYDEIKVDIKAKTKEYKEYLNYLIEKLKKKQENPFNSISIGDLDTSFSELEEEIEKVNKLIGENNRRTEKFDQAKQEAKEKILNHHAAEFINEKQYFEREDKIDELEEEMKDQKKEIGKLKRRIKDIERELSDEAKGADKLNEYIKKILFSSDLRIQLTDKEKSTEEDETYKMFTITRAGKPANNLSEGEKTAISFAYFIAKLEDKNTNLKDTIVFIDDPVSSLDKDHLYSIFGIICEKFSSENCRQLFLSTHNFEFFHLFKNEREISHNFGSNSVSLYLIKRFWNKSESNSTLKKLPESLKKYPSEYAYLFSQLDEFRERPSEDFEDYYLIPHIVRRVVEGYVEMRLPSISSLKKKVDYLIEENSQATQVYKYINEYSHQKQLQRNKRHPDLSETKKIVEIVVNSLKEKDKEHYEALLDL